MEFIFEIIFEFISECILSGAGHIAKSRKYPSLLRIIAALFLILLYAALIIGILVLGIIIINYSIPAAIVLIAIDIIVVAACGINFRNFRKTNKRTKIKK